TPRSATRLHNSHPHHRSPVLTPDAYEPLLQDVVQGDATLFMRADEVEAQWAIFTPLLEQIEAGNIEPHPYQAGGEGPRAAYELLESDGRYWHRPDAVKEP